MKNTDFLTTEKVTFQQNQIRLLDQINLSLPQSGLIALVGSNGAGKSTLLKILSGQLLPTSGLVKVRYEYLQPDSISRLEQVGYMPELIQYYPELTVIEQLEFVSYLKYGKLDKQMINDALVSASLDTSKYQHIGKLSLGYRQRLGLAQAFLGNPAISVLDEPMNGMDPELQMIFKKMLAKHKDKSLIIVSTHMIQEIESIADQVIFMRKGKVKRVLKTCSGVSMIDVYHEINATESIENIA